MVTKRKNVKFVLKDLKSAGIPTAGDYVLKFDIDSSVGVPHIACREGEKNQVGYITEQEVTYGASEREKDNFIFDHTRTDKSFIIPKRTAILISDKLHKIVLDPNEDHMFYLEDVARVILESNGQQIITLPDEVFGHERIRRKLGPGTIKKPSFSVKYANKDLEKELLEL